MTAVVVDTSAIVAILTGAAEQARFVDAILAADARFMSAVNQQEAGMLMVHLTGSEAGWEPLDALLERLKVEIVVHDAALALAAREAFLRYGPSRHPARLNFGDCAAYALAKANNLPLLFKGEGLAQTDVIRVGA